MTGQSEARLAAVRQTMAQTGADLLALGPGPHMTWLMGFHPHADERPCLLLISPTGETLLMPALNSEACRARTNISFHQWADADGPQAALAAALGAIGAAGATQVRLDETMRADFALTLLDTLPGARHGYLEQTVGALRMCKDADEVVQLKENAAIADRAMGAGFAALRPGISELEVADVIRAHFVSEGAAPVFWIIGTGPNGAFPHHQTGDTKLAAGDVVVIDVGGRKGAFPSDITRMATLGPPPALALEIHAIVNQAVEAALAAARPGVEARVVDAAARDTITNAGYGEYFVHRTGHGLGIEVHEPPYLTSTSRTVLQEGMVFSIEPGIYLPGKFGLRLEEIVILREEGPEILSGLARDFHVLPV
jgi:Xaa-Pro aminopeptidase